MSEWYKTTLKLFCAEKLWVYKNSSRWLGLLLKSVLGFILFNSQSTCQGIKPSSLTAIVKRWDKFWGLDLRTSGPECLAAASRFTSIFMLGPWIIDHSIIIWLSITRVYNVLKESHLSWKFSWFIIISSENLIVLRLPW